MNKINLADKLAQFDEYWSPKIVGELNGQHVKLAKIKGAFIWHHHEQEDEMFLVLDGRMRLEFRDRQVVLEKGECCIVPRGVEHRPVGEEEAHLLMFEPASTLNTGNVRNERTVDTLDRIKILRSLRAGEFDALIGINLLREGLDLPEVSMVAILDADKEGFLRSTTSMIQTIGRAARHINGKAILYADVMTGSMEEAIAETKRRRIVQRRYNEENNIQPQSIIKPLDPELVRFFEKDYYEIPAVAEGAATYDSAADMEAEIERLETEMRNAAKEFEFEKAALLRDQAAKLKKTLLEFMGTSAASEEL